jgi:hypothetical protein
MVPPRTPSLTVHAFLAERDRRAKPGDPATTGLDGIRLGGPAL